MKPVSALRIDLHVHTHYSSDAKITLKQIIEYARRKGLDGVAVTDHDTVLGARKLVKQKNFLIIPGIEVSSLQGHILGLNITEPVPPRLDITETVEKIRQLGGIAAIAHPSVVIKTGLGTKITSASHIDAVEVINASAFPFFISTYLGRRLAHRLNLPQIAGTDAHYPEEIGSAYTLVYAESNRDDVTAAIKKGRTEPLGEPISWIHRLARGSQELTRRLGRL